MATIPEEQLRALMAQSRPLQQPPPQPVPVNLGRPQPTIPMPPAQQVNLGQPPVAMQTRPLTEVNLGQNLQRRK